ncbi:hypothetical protein POJ06DRAFT_245533 [Lipomyces tetrasporus]|uniref:Uncharacterized protein n=1 Tax=Lipomyces tetrasporus TaxID=54092 RepID=A0AAD7QWI5_9ASCO|nr:uncharacterized protein POJ06DRAFT_245533 [Lipomyces tetrasporus]KAJ8102749.1 hypothetical protein POJ06DRAFT_245533 [Lipomyces tetrasporus]
MDESKLLIQTHTLPGTITQVTEYIYPCSGCKSRVTRTSMADLLAAFTSVSDGQFMRSCQRCRAKGIQNRKRRREEGTTDGQPGGTGPTAGDDEDEDDSTGQGQMDFEAKCGTFEEFCEALKTFMAQHDGHPEFDAETTPARFRITILASAIMPRSPTCPARTVDAVVRDTAESQKIAALMIRDSMFDCMGYFFQLRKGGRPHPDGGKYNFSCSRAEERKGAYDRTKRMREGGVRQRRTKTRDFFRCEGRVMMCFSKTNAWVTVAYGHKRHVETPKIHEKKEKQKEPAVVSSVGAHNVGAQNMPTHPHLDPTGQSQIDPALMDPTEALAHAAHLHHPVHGHGHPAGAVYQQDQFPNHGGISLHTVG